MSALIYSESLFSLDSQLVLSHLPCSILIKNEHLQFVAANQKAANLTGFKTANAMLGLNDSDLKCSAAEFAQDIQRQDRQVLEEGEQNFLDIGYYSSKGNLSILLTTKTKIQDQTNQVLILATTMEIPVKAVNSILFGLLDDFNKNKANCSYLLKNSSAEMKLSDRQAECLYYLLRGKSTKEIAACLQRSPRTIEDHITLLKTKFICLTKSELIEKALQLGFGQTIPPSLFNKAIGFGFKVFNNSA